MPSIRCRFGAAVGFAVASFACTAVFTPGIAQTQDPGTVVTSSPCHFGSTPPTPGPACLLAHHELGPLPDAPLYWHIDEFPNEAAAQAAKGKFGTVVTDYGKVWLFTIGGETWRAHGGVHAATIGPLPITKAASFSAEYLHSLFTPGMSAPIHRHSGPEGFYALDGDTCLEMPGGVHTATGPGNHLVMPGGPPMLLMATGTVPRRAFALILHDSTLPPTTRVTDWKPSGLCRAKLSSSALIHVNVSRPRGA